MMCLNLQKHLWLAKYKKTLSILLVLEKTAEYVMLYFSRDNSTYHE